jgi:hypothetical protein
MERRIAGALTFGLVVLAILGIAAMPAVSYSAHAKELQANCAAKASRCATLIIHVYIVNGGIERMSQERSRLPRRVPDETQPLRIGKLGPDGEVPTNRITEKHKLRVAPGRDRIAVIDRAAPGAHAYQAKNVTVSAGQTLSAVLYIFEQ